MRKNEKVVKSKGKRKEKAYGNENVVKSNYRKGKKGHKEMKKNGKRGKN